jgi:hypothetical protein
MFGANKFAQITGTSAKGEEPKQRSPSRPRQALDTSTQDYIPRGAVVTGVSEQPSLARSHYRAEIAQLERSPESLPTKYGANSFRMRQQTSGQAAFNSDRAETFLIPGACQSSHSLTNVNTITRLLPSIDAQPVSRSTEKPRVRHKRPARVQGAASFPIQCIEQLPARHTNQLCSPNENQPRSQTTAKPYHSPEEVVQPNGAEHNHLQQTKPSRQQQAERIHIQRMAQNRVKYAVQPHPEPIIQNSQQTAEHALRQHAEQPQPQPQHKEKQLHKLREQQKFPDAARPQPQAHVQPNPQRVKQLHPLLSEQAYDQPLERPSYQRTKQSRDQLADGDLPQPIGDPYHERTDSFHSQPQQQSCPKQSGHTVPQNVTQHVPKRKQPPPILRPKTSSTSIEVQPPTPQRQKAASFPFPELPTLSSLNISQIPPEPHTRSNDEVWVDSVNRQNFATPSILEKAAEKSANQSSNMSRYDSLRSGVEHLRHARSFSSMSNMGTERRGSWASLKTVVKKASGLMKRLHDPAGGPPGKK